MSEDCHSGARSHRSFHSFPPQSSSDGTGGDFDLCRLIDERYHCTAEEGRNRDPMVRIDMATETDSEGSVGDVVDVDNDNMVTVEIPYTKGCQLETYPSQHRLTSFTVRRGWCIIENSWQVQRQVPHLLSHHQNNGRSKGTRRDSLPTSERMWMYSVLPTLSMRRNCESVQPVGGVYYLKNGSKQRWWKGGKMGRYVKPWGPLLPFPF